ncbi:MAG: hypothetical protein ACLUD0_06430 [Eubacterium ramulus]
MMKKKSKSRKCHFPLALAVAFSVFGFCLAYGRQMRYRLTEMTAPWNFSVGSDYKESW